MKLLSLLISSSVLTFATCATIPTVEDTVDGVTKETAARGATEIGRNDTRGPLIVKRHHHDCGYVAAPVCQPVVHSYPTESYSSDSYSGNSYSSDSYSGDQHHHHDHC
ncbi:hypothetical protein H4Q26_010896 [Puccinia striiformis f. sp. tritici PST-130]|uniref:Uncharacterized protein n=1 Tax=Puccinia striiformis f. sp. tritici PST-78 TaxID=1165861 RepID=A0A0L0W3W5_9BASI|nr:hypothetical protein Pst134EB_027316 [Puccinia striiformis f. sp. tritici]KAI9616500.1 hypothetical protein H4Q26_010896 [Puccinia striiformis f. sp. tritici PST-130]KNF06167.1 hypothetical protein PSTG_00676 [Puccinia striiformis f. sp. tritici PST-78]